MNRIEKTLASVDLNGRGLEIGPSYNPMVPKTSNTRVKSVDHLDRLGLREKYSHLPNASIDAIEEVDYVWSGGSLFDLVGEVEGFDYIVASHFIEHSTDLLGFLLDCEKLLKPNGVLSLVVPDKRFCFDRFKSLTTIGGVICAHLNPKNYHPVSAIVDHLAYGVVMNENQLGWSPECNGQLHLQHSRIDQLREMLEKKVFEKTYIDIHRWIFTPTSFSLLVQDLRELGYLNLAEINSFETTEFEFFVSLTKSSNNVQHKDRLEMICKIERELQLVTECRADQLHPEEIKQPEFNSALAEMQADSE